MVPVIRGPWSSGPGFLFLTPVKSEEAEQEQQQLDETITFLRNYKKVKLIELYRRKLAEATEEQQQKQKARSRMPEQNSNFGILAPKL